MGIVQAKNIENVGQQINALEALISGTPLPEQDLPEVLQAAETIGGATLHLKGCASTEGGQYSLQEYKPDPDDPLEPALGRCATLFVRYSDGLSGLSCNSFDSNKGPLTTWYLGVPVPKRGVKQDLTRLYFSAMPKEGVRTGAGMDEAGYGVYAAALRPAARMLLHLLAPTELKSL